jgi:hypothetical protein
MNVQQFVSEAVKEGIALAPLVYLESLENSLRQDVLLSEHGNAANYLQALINEAAENIDPNEENQ